VRRRQPAQVFLFGKGQIDKKIPRSYSDKQRTGGPFTSVEELQSDGADITVALCLGCLLKVVGDISEG